MNVKKYAELALVVVVTMAIVNRIPQIKSIVG
jgi:hypothetical protein